MKSSSSSSWIELVLNLGATCVSLLGAPEEEGVDFDTVEAPVVSDVESVDEDPDSDTDDVVNDDDDDGDDVVDDDTVEEEEEEEEVVVVVFVDDSDVFLEDGDVVNVVVECTDDDVESIELVSDDDICAEVELSIYELEEDANSFNWI
ncbi:hypothetical protein WICMUC_000367 [Wickerhamomyces mucosus]|uniref:Uncharacterized protein n=1 Tax=Wickerhamomyces mucosus TaxID=1378264 RepID=A0A9P8TJB4_9ASCO|nr:hypothetical protein WICMUC_000367 [Wickerhamomyces mucosus]